MILYPDDLVVSLLMLMSSYPPICCLIVGPQASLSPSTTPVRWMLGTPSESMKYHIALVDASKAQLEPKWNQKASKSLQHGTNSCQKTTLK